MLPKGWSFTTVSDACEAVSVGIVVNPSQYYVNQDSGVRAFRSQNVRENQVNENNWAYISAEGHTKNQKSILRQGDVVVVRTGFAGVACVVPPHLDGVNCIDVLFARPRKTHLLPEYLCELTNSELGRRQVFNGQSGLAQKHLNVSTYERLGFPLPPPSEQKRLVEILNTWNAAIGTAEKLLANSRRQKEALTHDLLFGRVRRPGYANSSKRVMTRVGRLPQDWKHVPLSEVAAEISMKNAGDEALPVLSCTKHHGLVDSLSYFNKRVFSENTSTYKIVPRAAFAYATNHIDEGSIGYQGLYDNALISPMYTVFQVGEQIDHGFLFRLLKTEHYRQLFAANTNASVDRRGSLRWNEFKRIEIPVPSLEEQLAVREVLDAADQEVEQLTSQLEALKAEKHALMADLLTGKRRVGLPQATREPEAA